MASATQSTYGLMQTSAEFDMTGIAQSLPHPASPHAVVPPPLPDSPASMDVVVHYGFHVDSSSGVDPSCGANSTGEVSHTVSLTDTRNLTHTAVPTSAESEEMARSRNSRYQRSRKPKPQISVSSDLSSSS